MLESPGLRCFALCLALNKVLYGENVGYPISTEMYLISHKALKKFWKENNVQILRFQKVIMQIAAPHLRWSNSAGSSQKSCGLRFKLELDGSLSHLNTLNDHVQDENITGLTRATLLK